MEQEINCFRGQDRKRSYDEKPLGNERQNSKERKTSSKKIQANRRNALKSTGPRTAAGKKVVAQNATKHGFFSKGLLIQHPFGNESQNEYDDWHEHIREHFQPEGFAEEYWVESIAVYLLRLRRVFRFESGEIAANIVENRRMLLQDSARSNGSGPCSERDCAPELLRGHVCLPPRDSADIILRYELVFNKQLNHAFAELERLQRQRMGDSVPAPLRIAVSGTT